MGLLNVSFKDLQYLRAVVGTESITHAARICSVSQPALSERIKKIETAVGQKLFERRNRRLIVTPAGHLLAERAAELLGTADHIDGELSKFCEPMNGELHLGVITTLGPYLSPYLMPLVRRRFPKLHLVVHEGVTDWLSESLMSGALDLMIATAPLHVRGIAYTQLCREKFVLAVPQGHRFSKLEKISASELKGEEMLLLGDGHSSSEQPSEGCLDELKGRARALQGATLETLMQMIKSGSGYSLIPELAAKHLAQEGISFVEINGDDTIGRELVIVYRDTYFRLEELRLLKATLYDALPTFMERTVSREEDDKNS